MEDATTKHTPGPWEAVELNKGEAVIVQPCDTSIYPICLVDRQEEQGLTRTRIAAAPELYEALKRMERIITELYPGHIEPDAEHIEEYKAVWSATYGNTRAASVRHAANEV